MPDPSSDAQELRALEEKRRTSGLTPDEEARRAALQGAEPPRPAVKGFDIRAAAAGVRALLADGTGAPPPPAPAAAPQAGKVAGLPAPPPPPRATVAEEETEGASAGPSAHAALAPPEAAAPAPPADALPAHQDGLPPADAAAPGLPVPVRPGAPRSVESPDPLEEPELIEDLEPLEELEPIDEAPVAAASAPLTAAGEAPIDAAAPPPAPDWMAPPPSTDGPPAETYPSSLELLAPTEEPSPSPVPGPGPELTDAGSAPSAAPVPGPSSSAPSGEDVRAEPALVPDGPADAAVEDPARAPARYTAVDYGLDPDDPTSAAWAAWYASQGWDPGTAYAWAERMHQETGGAAVEGSDAPAEPPAPASDLRFEAAPTAPGPADGPGRSDEVATLEPAVVEAFAQPGTDDVSGFMVPAPAAPALVPVPAEEEIAIEADLATMPSASPAEDVAIEEAPEDVAEDVVLPEEIDLASLPEPGPGPAATTSPADDAMLPDEALGAASPGPDAEPFEQLPLGDELDTSSIPPLARSPFEVVEAEDAARFELADSGTFAHAPLGLAGSTEPLPEPSEDDAAPLEGLEWVQTSAVPGDELPVDLSTFEQPPARGEDPSEHATVVWSLGQGGHAPTSSVRAPPREAPEAMELAEDDILELPVDAPEVTPRADDDTATEAFPALAPAAPPLASAAPDALDDRTLVMPLGGRAQPPPPPAPTPPAPGDAHVPGTHRVVVHTAEGEVRRGTLTDPSLDGKELILHPQGGGVPNVIATEDVKAVFFMLPAGAPAPDVKGQRVRVTFRDGRQVAGFSPDYHPDRVGFFMVPADSRTHTERIWVYRAAVRQVVVS